MAGAVTQTSTRHDSGRPRSDRTARIATCGPAVAAPAGAGSAARSSSVRMLAAFADRGFLPASATKDSNASVRIVSGGRSTCSPAAARGSMNGDSP
jgi:hypothetical protein